MSTPTDNDSDGDTASGRPATGTPAGTDGNSSNDTTRAEQDTSSLTDSTARDIADPTTPDADTIDASTAGQSGTALFVRRPILAFVFSALIAIAGLAALFAVEVRELPNVDRPVVTVTTNFNGAGPDTVDREVTSRIEGAMGRVAGVQALSSSSRFGRSRVVAEFSDDTDIDVAATDIRDAIGRIRNTLPDDVAEPRIVKADSDADAVMRISVTSASRSVQDLTRLVEDVVEDRLISAPGVADLQIFGARDPIFRVDIDMLELASRGLSLSELRAALSNVSFDVPAGALNSSRQNIQVRTTAAVSTPAQFEALVIRDGIRMGDVARVSLGPAPGETILRANDQSGLGLGIIRQAQSNTLDISATVTGIVAELQDILPDDVNIFITSDEATFVSGAIEEVVSTLALALLIVVAIIYLFLRDARATLIPTVTLPVALIGTLAAIWIAGFSVNILTLLALVLATGMVVDDAIVVLENIVRRRAQGMGPRAAAVLGTRQVFFAVVTTTATLAAVFIPLSFLPGQAGGLFREFGFTLAMAVMLSSVVALTLCPVLASRLLTATPDPDPRGPLVWLGNRLAGAYANALRAALAMPGTVVTLAVVFAATAALGALSIRQELTPAEDRGVAILSLSGPQGVALDYTDRKMREIEDIIAPLRASGEITNLFAIAGLGGQENRGFMVMTLAPWDARTRSQNDIVGEINAGLRNVIGVRAFAIQPNSLGIRGAGRGLSFAVVGNSYEAIAERAEALVAAMSQNPGFGQVRLDFETTQPELFIQIDRERASDIGVDINGLGEALQAVLDGRSVGDVFIDNRTYDIQMLSTRTPVRDPGDLGRILVRSENGTMVPMSSFVTLQERATAPQLAREGQMPSVEISAGLTDALALGPAMQEAQRIADGVLDPGQRIVPLAEAASLDETSSGILLVFGFAILVVFLVLAAQFESFISAIVVMATVPLGLACAMVALWLTGTSLNVYSQIGLVLLVGIMAKNGILIVEFANQLRDAGADVYDAIFRASTIRLRPVMMTMTSTVLGGVPLILSSGAGAEAREALGWVVVGGLGLATLATLFLTPVAYLLLAGFSAPRAAQAAALDRELVQASAR
ncbi:efflux RND transporter permease subunit [Roseicitreum antarcticum]|uniref:Hydrophobic/amphiphilic exporter-1, HAE1 family n=1 Tax=Roseicitreum antarcticum TaxID=564137 RepID=A0A1H2Z724_9RHOB|nr:efflux RND transporter permease subunit [Roseicitreum antarcticum]SDX13262.1 hydrophobic/amphiphilic exporter-1, HAE1 family [Roseicitreum antarcticum]